MSNITIHAHLTRESGSDYLYSFIELTEEQTEQIASILNIEPEDVDNYINDAEYFGDHGDTWISEPLLDKYIPWNLMECVHGRYTYPGFTIEVNETFEDLSNCAEAISRCDMLTLKQLARYGGKAYGELCDRLTRERDRRREQSERGF